MNVASKISAVFLASFVFACRGPLVPTNDVDAAVPSDVEATVDGVERVDASNGCASACSKLSLLHCPEAEGARYAACLSVCSKSESGGGVVTFNTVCIYNAKDVKAVRLCNVRCGGD